MFLMRVLRPRCFICDRICEYRLQYFRGSYFEHRNVAHNKNIKLKTLSFMIHLELSNIITD
jgi:hypothetical protein